MVGYALYASNASLGNSKKMYGPRRRRDRTVSASMPTPAPRRVPGAACGIGETVRPN